MTHLDIHYKGACPNPDCGADYTMTPELPEDATQDAAAVAAELPSEYAEECMLCKAPVVMLKLAEEGQD